jgi:hypothetical protein
MTSLDDRGVVFILKKNRKINQILTRSFAYISGVEKDLSKALGSFFLKSFFQNPIFKLIIPYCFVEVVD